MAQKKVTYLSFEQLLKIFKKMVKEGWKADVFALNDLRLKSPRGREYCYCPIGALIKCNGFTPPNGGSPNIDLIASGKLVSKTNLHPRTALSVALAADAEGHINVTTSSEHAWSLVRRKALFRVFGLDPKEA